MNIEKLNSIFVRKNTHLRNKFNIGTRMQKYKKNCLTDFSIDIMSRSFETNLYSTWHFFWTII